MSVVMPFAGSREEALAAVAALAGLNVNDGDELLLADNAGVLATADGERGATVTVVAATGERSPAHARNAGAAAARGEAEWILFLDADTTAPPDLIDRYFAAPIAGDIGALAGGIRPAAPPRRAGVAARYAAHKNFLDAGAHLAHPYLPRVAAANLLVRRAAFDAVGGFYEGVRAAEDTDFCWRLQRAGWRLEACPGAVVEHRYRDSLAALRRQWRSYAAGRAWLARRYEGFTPRPALARAADRAMSRGGLGDSDRQVKEISHRARVVPRDRAAFAAVDVILGVEELIGFAQANRPSGAIPVSAPGSAHRVLVADRFPAPGVTAGPGARVEAAARPERPEPAPPDVIISYREDDGLTNRVAALVRLGLGAPGTTAAALAHDPRAAAALAPAAWRLRADPAATLAAAPDAADAARALARLAGRRDVP
ncbi:MAG TPA: glycosyltransferase family 2 protein [Solirubrobacteraceae bacterium]|nr:glycosyltransferase family 2 protein [Solirubrobacteraceae bacterium]